MAVNAAKLDPSPHKLKPRYCVCSNSTLPASCQATPVPASPKITPTRPNIAHLECNNSHSRNRLMSNASLNGTIVLSVGLLSVFFNLPMTFPDGSSRPSRPICPSSNANIPSVWTIQTDRSLCHRAWSRPTTPALPRSGTRGRVRPMAV